MKSLISILGSAVSLLIVLEACTPQPAPTLAASATLQSPGGQATPSLVPINLAGPEMKVGSSWLYADGTLLVPVPGGIYTRGHGGPDDAVKQVNVSDFWIYRTKVTNAQYAYCVSQGGCTPPNKTDNPSYYSDALQSQNPVVGVDYSQAKAYCTFVHARLPTEAEWEKMARGLDARIYPWGEAAPNCNLLNYETCQGKTTPVNAYPQGQSYYQAFDTEGNTFEWAADWYQQDYYLIAPPDDPPGPAKGVARVVRSSAFNSGTNQTQVYNRFHSGPTDHRNNLGFRCVVEDPTYFASFCNYPPTYGTDGLGGASIHGSVQVDCPVLSINQVSACEAGQPVTTVTFNSSEQSPTGTFSTPPDCIIAAGGKFICHKDGQLQFCNECKVTVNLAPVCPQGYAWNAQLHTCLAEGGPGMCLSGTTLDPAGQCCTFEAGPAVSTAQPSSPGVTVILYPSQQVGFVGCPAGTWPYTAGANPECVAYPVQSPDCTSAGVSLADCSPKGCKEPVGGCGLNSAWNPDTCSCVCSGC